MNYNIECESDDFGLSSTTKKYATLFKVPFSLKGEHNYNDIQMIFRIYHISSTSGISYPKDYLLTVVKDKNNIVNLIDLNSEVESDIILGYTISNDEVFVSCKGYIIGARVKLQVIYCTCIGMFTFYNCCSFTNDITVTLPINNNKRSEIIFLNNWNRNQYYPSYCTQGNQLVTVNINMNNGITDPGTIVCKGLPRPQNVIHIPTVDSDGLGGCLTLNADGTLSVKIIQNAQKDIMASFSYYKLCQ